MSNAPQFIAHIRDLIAKDKIDTAFKELLPQLKGSEYLNKINLLFARHHSIIEKIHLGTVDDATASIEQNKIRSGLLGMLDLIEEEYSTKPEVKAEVEQYTRKNVVNQSSIHAGQNAIIGDGNTINYITNGDTPQNKAENNRKLLKIGAAIVAIIGLVASIAQISGYSLKDFLFKEEKPVIISPQPVLLPKKDTIVLLKEKPQVSKPKQQKLTEKLAPKNHFESKDNSKQINIPDNQGTINIDQ